MHNTINTVGQTYTRPWGSYTTLAQENGFQVKILSIQPGGQLSLQRHFQRSEHWTVVQGQPTLTLNDTVKVYQRNEHIFIPKQAVHRIENFTQSPCQIIEVQIGDYLGEDDIERLDDVYNRSTTG
tara:strand:+ start:203 stop:577 length:375 start_codon:yes stop_codon:yes gene_type:complete